MSGYDGLDKSDVEEHVKNLFWDLINAYNTKNTGERINTYHVSDFTSPCMRKPWYGRTQPRPEPNAEEDRHLWLGNIVHEHTTLESINEMTMCYDIVKDMAIPPKTVQHMPKDDTVNIITGTLDDLLFYKDHAIIADKKTWNGGGREKWEPNEEYVKQLNIYRVLLWETAKIDARIGCLLFLDKTEDLRPQPIAFDLDPIQKTKQFMREKLEDLKQSNGPNASVCWLCTGQNRKNKFYCPWTNICSKETDRDKQLRDMLFPVDGGKLDHLAVDDTIKNNKTQEL